MMTRFDINILGKNYVFLGINESVKNVIEAQANVKNFREDFELWRQWMQRVTKEEIIVVCDPYGMEGVSLDNISTASSSLNEAEITREAAEAEITREAAEAEITREATEAANALVAYLGGSAESHVVNWTDSIKDMFRQYSGAKIFGMQYNNEKLNNTSVGSFETVLFIDFKSLIKKKPGLLLPTVMHETTHFLEVKQLGNNFFGERGILKERVDDDGLWGVESAGSLGKDSDWQGIFEEMAVYQRKKYKEHEMLATLIEKMTVGSLYESEDRRWVERLKIAFHDVLAERGIKLTENA